MQAVYLVGNMSRSDPRASLVTTTYMYSGHSISSLKHVTPCGNPSTTTGQAAAEKNKPPSLLIGPSIQSGVCKIPLPSRAHAPAAGLVGSYM